MESCAAIVTDFDPSRLIGGSETDDAFERSRRSRCKSEHGVSTLCNVSAEGRGWRGPAAAGTLGILSFLLVRFLGGFAADYFRGHSSALRAAGLSGARCRGFGETDAWLITIGELHAGRLDRAPERLDRPLFQFVSRSNLATVSVDTLAAAASSRTPQPKAARAIRHCTGKKIIGNVNDFSLQLDDFIAIYRNSDILNSIEQEFPPTNGLDFGHWP